MTFNRNQSTWTLADMPDLNGRTAIVTGTTEGGLGYYTALELARHGARVVLVGRSSDKLAASESAILKLLPEAGIERLVVDLADLSSVRAGAAAASGLGPIDLLVNNAGIMAPGLRRTPDNIESQMATNHFGPFLFTGLLFEQLCAAGDARVVTVSSLMHQIARSAPLGDPRAERAYRRWPVYGQSKLANLLFTHELERRCRQEDLPVRALAAHPGLSGTHLVANGQFGTLQTKRASILDGAVKLVSQSAADGALPSLMAATADLPGGTYCGPGGPGQLGGTPRTVGSTRLARNAQAQRRLWEVSEEAVGLRWPQTHPA